MTLNKFFYVAKGNAESYDPNFYFIETELTREQLASFLLIQAEKYALENGVESGDECFNDFEVEINGKQYFFCVGDHLNQLLEARSVIYNFDEIMSKPIHLKILTEMVL
jgi:hypothetical protein